MKLRIATTLLLTVFLAGCGANSASPTSPSASQFSPASQQSSPHSPTSTSSPTSPSSPTTATPANPPTTTAIPPPTSPATFGSAGTKAPAPPSRDVASCFDGDCTLMLAGPTVVPLDSKKLHYDAIRVTAVRPESLSYTVDYPGSGGSDFTMGPGLNQSSFGFGGSPLVEVGLILVGSRPALVLQLGPVTS